MMGGAGDKGGMTVNRENKRRKYEKGYYKKHACLDRSRARSAGAKFCPRAQAATTATIARTAFRAFMWITSPETAPPSATASWSHQRVGAQKRGVGCHSPLHGVRQNGL